MSAHDRCCSQREGASWQSHSQDRSHALCATRGTGSARTWSKDMWRWRSSGNAPSSCVQPWSERAADSVWSSRHCSLVRRVSTAAATSPADRVPRSCCSCQAASMRMQTWCLCSQMSQTANENSWYRTSKSLTIVADQLTLAEFQDLQACQLRYRGHCIIAKLLATANTNAKHEIHSLHSPKRLQAQAIRRSATLGCTWLMQHSAELAV